MLKIYKNVNYVDFFILVLIVVFFPPLILERMSDTLDKMKSLLQILFLLVLLFMLIKQRKLKSRPAIIAWCVFCAYGLAVTCMWQRENIYRYVIAVIIPIAYVILICMYCQSLPNGMMRLSKLMAFYWETLIVLNMLLMLAFPHGVVQSTAGSTHERANWLLGSKNNTVFPMILGVCFILHSYRYGGRRRKLFTALVIALAALEIFMSGPNGIALGAGSTTGLVTFMLLFMMYFCRNLFHRLRLDAVLTILAIALVFLLFDALLVFGSTGDQSVFSKVANLLNKDSTGSGRTVIWANSLKAWLEAPLFGSGYVFTTFSKTATGTYNFYLDCMVKYGIVGLALIFIVFYFYKRMGRINLYACFLIEQESFIFMIGFICLMICGFVNTIKWQYMVMILEMYAFTDSRDYNRATMPTIYDWLEYQYLY